MINNLYNIGLTSLQNAQVSIDNASNNIANADTTGYQKTTAIYETSDSITLYGLSVGTGASVVAIQTAFDQFVEAQYLDAFADLERQTAAYGYLYQLDSLFNQTDSGLSTTLDDFLLAWNDLATDPDSLSAREAQLGETQTLIYGLNSTAEQLESTVDSINAEISDEVDAANQLIEDIAQANVAIVANPDDLQAISDRDQMIRDLDALIGVDTIYKSNGEVTILTDEGYTMVDGAQTHSLVYSDQQATTSLLRDSDYDGSVQFSGTSSEELLIEFVSTGTDGTAQFKVSTDGGTTWLEDEDGDTMLYTAGDEDSPVEIEGVEIWFEDGTTDHTAGDRYTIIPKSGLYWESSDGSLKNITPMTDDSGQDVSGRTSGGSLAGLFTARDDTVIPTLDDLDDLAEALIWEVNSAHSQGAGLEAHTGVTGSYSVDDSSAMLSNSGLNYADEIQAGDLQLITYNDDDTVSTSSIISIDPATDSLDDVVTAINTAFVGELTASVNSDGQLVLASASDMTFEIAGDSSNLLAALGTNTFFAGTDASSISLDSYVSTDTSHINTGVVGDDGLVSSGSNSIATMMAELSSTTTTVGGLETSLTSALATIVSEVGSAVSSTELKQTYAQTSAEYLYNQQASANEVNVDEELIELTKQQQQYQAAAEIISITQTMMDTILDMV
ncbi:flagellar hook-associated protein FlgK [Pseudodesulfovibrio sediminis]|uniref:Flagellar hook-associated protein 1 n=1 Tax=Pseudodesulfovibrio sediminis TaxID=2810563 RepID=A0ABN6ER81_9BACT|nr:flagellar basal body rod C-terminal domain-containing protein [Pseudodesulfovibrio sediminis]BCS87651.1 flagellar hook-associated protein FlgK [Pseudodesulfovibrio sediminis]